MDSSVMWRAFIVSYACVNAYSDLRWRTIPRRVALVGLLAGLLVNWHHGQLATALIASLAAFGIGMGLFSIGAIGGGDVKLITALAAMLGLHPWAKAMEFSIFAAALIAIVQVLRRGAVRQTLANIATIVSSWFKSGFKAHPVLNVRNPAMIRSPFAVAAACGTVAVVLRLV